MGELREVRRLRDGRYQVTRADGACLSLSLEEWQDALDQIEDLEFEGEGECSSPS